jgi:primosomal protein N''
VAKWSPGKMAILYGIKTPTVEIPIFNGGFNGTNFMTFWQLFKSLIDETTIPDVVKYGLLHSKLEGIPKQIIKGDNKLDITSENYEKAKKILKDTYGKTEDNLRRIRADLFKISVCRQNSEVHTMFHLADSLISQIEALTEETNNSPEILQYLESCLPPNYLARLIREKRGIASYNLTEFRRILPMLISEDQQLNQIIKPESRNPVSHFAPNNRFT